MPTLNERIRRARSLCGLSQSGLAALLGVQRGAVTRWEHPAGNAPSTRHLIEIARCTRTRMEWLALGHGPPRTEDATAFAPDDEPWARAENDLELDCLRCLRRMPNRQREQVVALMRSMVR
ncbi:MAG: helix-turn-helix domain-containing protein [Lysobacteraceae bacterium]